MHTLIYDEPRTHLTHPWDEQLTKVTRALLTRKRLWDWQSYLGEAFLCHTIAIKAWDPIKCPNYPTYFSHRLRTWIGAELTEVGQVIHIPRHRTDVTHQLIGFDSPIDGAPEMTLADVLAADDDTESMREVKDILGIIDASIDPCDQIVYGILIDNLTEPTDIRRSHGETVRQRCVRLRKRLAAKHRGLLDVGQ